MRKELITVDDIRGRKIKTLRFGDFHGNGKGDPKDDLDLGDEWAGSLGMVEWVELGKAPTPKEFRVINRAGAGNMAFRVPLDYKLKEGEEFVY